MLRKNIPVPTSHSPEDSAGSFKGRKLFGLAWKREDTGKGMREDSEVKAEHSVERCPGHSNKVLEQGNNSVELPLTSWEPIRALPLTLSQISHSEGKALHQALTVRRIRSTGSGATLPNSRTLTKSLCFKMAISIHH